MSKNILASKTFWGAVVTLVAVVFPGLWMILGLGDDYGMVADKIQAAAGFILVIYGRYAAGGVHLFKA